jgi:TRAP transporter TAXI family solute receptor
VVIGSGSVTGIYYQVGEAIEKVINRSAKGGAINCISKSTEGSGANIDGVLSGEQEFGIAQADIHFQAWTGRSRSPWAGKPQKNLRSVFSLHTEAVTLLAAVDKGIDDVADLKGKRISVGEKDSGQYVNAMQLFWKKGIWLGKDLKTAYASPVDSLFLFQRDKIDAFFFTVGHPNSLFKEAAADKRNAAFIPIALEEEVYRKFPFYTRTMIPVDEYPGIANTADVETVGMKATLVTSSEVPDSLVYGITRAVFENLDTFRSQLAVLGPLTPTGMLEGLSAPIHPGALKYYREAGLPVPPQ